jgi:hypothetical protein
MSGVIKRKPGEPVIIEFDLKDIDGNFILPDVLSLSKRNATGVITTVRIDLTDTVAPTIELTLVGSLLIPTIDDATAVWTLYVDGAPVRSGLTGSFELNDLNLPTGDYEVSAQAVDRAGNASALTASLSVSVVTVNNPPVASYTQILDGLSVDLDASASSDPDGDALSYIWTFGNGASAEGAQVTYTYATAGNYSVTLTVSDGELTATQTKLLAVIDDVVEPEPTLVESFIFSGFTVRIPTVVETFTFSNMTVEA